MKVFTSDNYVLPLPLGHRSPMESTDCLAGADPYVHDTLGRLSVTMAGLAERHRLVFDTLSRAGVPFALTMAGVRA